jgi:hypothetical protein
MKINKNIAVSESGFIFNPSSGDSFSANQIGADIITLMKEEKKIPEIIKTISSKYDVEPSVFEKDLEDFISQLRDNNLANHDN